MLLYVLLSSESGADTATPPMTGPARKEPYRRPYFLEAEKPFSLNARLAIPILSLWG